MTLETACGRARSIWKKRPVAGGAAVWITLIYGSLATVPLYLMVTSAPGQMPSLVLPLHLVLVGVLLTSARRPERAWQVTADLLPLGLIPLMYAELPYLMAAFGAGYNDFVVQQWEHFLFASQPSRTLAARLPTRWISEPLHAAYLSYYAMIYAPLAYLYLRRDRAEFRENATAVMLTFAICFAIFAVFPVQGPRYLWPSPPDVPAGPFRATVLILLEGGSSRGAAFPSSHMAVAVVQALMAFRWRLPGARIVAGMTLLIGIGAVYGGFHYAIDMIAGALLGSVVVLAVRARSVKSRERAA